jgi:uncharacterized protein (TIGR03435 family)
MKTIAILLVTAAGLGAQSFEVASIKPAAPPAPGKVTRGGIRLGFRGGPGTDDPGLFTCLCALTMLVTQAYDIPHSLLSAPDWMNGAWFDLSAKVPAGTSKEQLRLMLQGLLIERFKLKIHRDPKEMSTYNLVVAKGGPRLGVGIKESVEQPAGADDSATPQPAGDKPPPGVDGFPVWPPGYKAPKGRIEIGKGGKARIRGDGETMQELAERLSSVMGKPVKDTTGLSGKYDYSLTFDFAMLTERDNASSNATSSSTPLAGSADGAQATPIEREIQSQLGLKLESKKGQMEMIVVDHAEKVPTQN